MHMEVIGHDRRTAAILLGLAAEARTDWDFGLARELIALAREARAGGITIKTSAIVL